MLPTRSALLLIPFLASLTLASREGHAAGDPARGRELAAACAACHGAEGNSPSPTFPILAGQHQDYLFQSLLAYQNGTRADSIMGGAIRTFDRQGLEDLSAYFASQAGLKAAAPAGGTGGGAPGGGGMTAALATSTEAGQLMDIKAPPSPPGAPGEASGCPAGGSADRDGDGDGLADAFDSAPKDAGEFVRDTDGDGWFGICSAEQLQAIQTLGTAAGTRTTLSLATRNTRRYELARDLDAAGIANWQPVGNCGTENNCMVARDKYGFAGAVDGNGHAIRNLSINRPETGGVGLFGTLAKTGVVRNLSLENATVTGLHGTGSLVGANFGLVADCRASVKVQGRLATAGLVGGNAGQVVNCQVSGEVSGEAAVGGLAGDMNGIVRDSAADMRVTAKKGTGGLVGLNTTGQVLNSHATGLIRASDNVGGLVGVNTDALVANSFATTVVEADGTNAGGLVGFNSQSRIRNSFATGPVTGKTAVGALVGRNAGSISNAYATGTTSGPGEPAASGPGPLVGDNAGGTVGPAGD